MNPFMITWCCIKFLLTYRISEDQLINDRQRLESLKYDKYVGLGPYVNDVKGFYPYVEELKNSIFRFKKEDTEAALAIFQSIKNTYRASKKVSLTANITMVSIHVRLTDFAHHLKVLFNMTFISNKFLSEAMEYYTFKYEVS